MAILISITLFAVLGTIIFLVGQRHYARPSRYYEQLGVVNATTGNLILDRLESQDDGVLVRVIRKIGEAVPIDPQDASLTRRLLMAAGYRNESALGIYSGLRVLSVVWFPLVAFVLRGYVTSAFVLQVVLVVAAAGIGLFLPSFILEMMVDNRQERIRLSLPDALDLLVVCVESGLGLDQAVVNVARELDITHPDVSEEFNLVTLEIQAGKRRSDAFRNLAERTGESELRKLVALLIQTDRFGTSMAESLRTHSDFMRVRRRQEAEERANKIGVKLVFPIFFFILPAMLVVVAGPGLLQVFKHLFPLMRNFNG